MRDDHMVHVNHCCTLGCKYGDDDCPIASGKVLPQYRCEECVCLDMNPGADVKADEWWSNLTPAQKAMLYLSQQL